jgi:peptidoglycan hydrolase CwlO-like protein
LFRSAREDDLTELEEERDLLERRLQRIEKELEELQQKTSEKRG